MFSIAHNSLSSRVKPFYDSVTVLMHCRYTSVVLDIAVENCKEIMILPVLLSIETKAHKIFSKLSSQAIQF